MRENICFYLPLGIITSLYAYRQNSTYIFFDVPGMDFLTKNNSDEDLNQVGENKGKPGSIGNNIVKDKCDVIDSKKENSK